MVIERPFFKPCAIWFGANFMCAIAASTASRLSSDTLAVPFRMRETVLGDTPAWRATSSRVEGGAAWALSFKVIPGYQDGWLSVL